MKKGRYQIVAEDFVSQGKNVSPVVNYKLHVFLFIMASRKHESEIY